MKISYVLIAVGLLAGCNANSSDAAKPKAVATAATPARNARAATPTQIVNGDFEQPMAADGSIPGWSQTQHAGPKSYDMRIEQEGAYQGKGSFHMKRIRPQVYGALVQDLDLSAYAGKNVELSAMLKTRDVGEQGWKLSLSAPGVAVLSTPMTGTADWTRQSITAKLPANSRHVNVGVTLVDEGEGWADNIELKVLD